MKEDVFRDLATMTKLKKLTERKKGGVKQNGGL